jgi:hypothetical protein
MRIHADVELDRRGVMLTEAVDVPLPTVTLTTDVRSSASAEQMDLLREQLAMSGPISTSIRASGRRSARSGS